MKTTKFLVAPLTAAVLLGLFLNGSGYAADFPNTETDLVAFFKQAVNSPPDIEKFVAKRANLLLPANLPEATSSFQWFEGAVSGTNFFLHHLPDPNMPADTNHFGVISARSGSVTYEVGGHGIIYGVGKSGLTEDVKANFQLLRQTLCMGAGEIEAGTVKWNGNEFTAKNLPGKDVRGSLQFSNNLPFKLEFYLADEPSPYKVVEYTYATPADSFAGYPAKFLISYNFKDKLNQDKLAPIAEIEFKSVLLAKQPLTASFFSEARFADLIQYTNIQSNSDLYVSDSKTKQLVKIVYPKAGVKKALHPSSNSEDQPESHWAMISLIVIAVAAIGLAFGLKFLGKAK